MSTEFTTIRAFTKTLMNSNRTDLTETKDRIKLSQQDRKSVSVEPIVRPSVAITINANNWFLTDPFSLLQDMTWIFHIHPLQSNTLQDDAWFAFGFGPRSCPGVRWVYLLTKIFIVELLRNYRVVKCAKTLEPSEWEFQFKKMTFGPSKDLLVAFERRV